MSAPIPLSVTRLSSHVALPPEAPPLLVIAAFRGDESASRSFAAMLEACKVAGAGTAKILRHATSYETLAAVAPQPPTNAVGYAAVVVG